jgi:hypothetical protein
MIDAIAESVDPMRQLPAEPAMAMGCVDADHASGRRAADRVRRKHPRLEQPREPAQGPEYSSSGRRYCAPSATSSSAGSGAASAAESCGPSSANRSRTRGNRTEKRRSRSPGPNRWKTKCAEPRSSIGRTEGTEKDLRSEEAIDVTWVVREFAPRSEEFGKTVILKVGS